ncbi:TonB-dependent receptor domain-containing protein [Bacteroidetes bacterium endosymbiont of Geopemphigus sp.]|uniref:TonB-dependent receptor domain-containing protein n=1 Tax=Bacteroidetes bacterium endosymbiont of Geopemphigus sp. TaxID=2047937 RepID=UPI000CD216FC|nr:TonB-dependent receptor [Bacteroidetes bacterium endosymbiont of Geopemphigus sp.]
MFLLREGNLSYNSTIPNLGLRYNRFKVFKPFLSFSQSFSIAQLDRKLRNVEPGKGAILIFNLRPKAVIANNYDLGFNSFPDEFFHLEASVFFKYF